MNLTTDDMAWLKAQAMYVKGDTLEIGVKKALEAGYSPGTTPFKAFVGAFFEMIQAEHPTGHKNASAGL